MCGQALQARVESLEAQLNQKRLTPQPSEDASVQPSKSEAVERKSMMDITGPAPYASSAAATTLLPAVSISGLPRAPDMIQQKVQAPSWRDTGQKLLRPSLHTGFVIIASGPDYRSSWQVTAASCEGMPSRAASGGQGFVSRAGSGMVGAASSGPSQMVVSSGPPLLHAMSSATATSQLTAAPQPVAHAAASEAEALTQEAAQLKAQAENFKVSFWKGSSVHEGGFAEISTLGQ